MHLLGRQSLIVAVVLVAAVLTLGAAVVCADGIHATASGMSPACASMKHAALFGAKSSPYWSPAFLSQLLAVMAGAALVLTFVKRDVPVAVVGRTSSSPPDPLMGRLRI